MNWSICWIVFIYVLYSLFTVVYCCVLIKHGLVINHAIKLWIASNCIFTARRLAKRGICRRRVSVCVCVCVCNGGRRGSSIWGPISSSPTDCPRESRRLTSQHGEPLLLSRPRCSTGLTSGRVTPVCHVRLQRRTGSIWPLSLGIWRHVSRSTTPRCDALIGGKGVTLASWRVHQVKSLCAYYLCIFLYTVRYF